MLCTARRPLCDGCPLREGCRARQEAPSAGWPRPERKSPAYRYEYSNRFYRGRVLAELREDSRAGGDGVAVRELGQRLGEDFAEGEARWLHAARESLCKDGLAKVSPASDAIGSPEVIVEGRAPYGAGPREPSLDARVSLP